MTKFILDANLSPQTATFLRDSLGLDIVHQRDVLPGSPSDDEIVAFAKSEQRIIVTFDTDFGEIYHFREKGAVGIIQLQLRDQTVNVVNRSLFQFLSHMDEELDLDRALVTIEEHQVRILGSD